MSFGNALVALLQVPQVVDLIGKGINQLVEEDRAFAEVSDQVAAKRHKKAKIHKRKAAGVAGDPWEACFDRMVCLAFDQADGRADEAREIIRAKLISRFPMLLD